MKSKVGYIGKRQHYIDKTEVLEKGIAAFPSIYIEGAAGTGKTSAVRMLLEKHSKTEYIILDALQDIGKNEALSDTLAQIRAQMEEKEYWLIIENINQAFSNDDGGGAFRFCYEYARSGEGYLCRKRAP